MPCVTHLSPWRITAHPEWVAASGHQRPIKALRDGTLALAWTTIDCATDQAMRTRLLTTA